MKKILLLVIAFFCVFLGLADMANAAEEKPNNPPVAKFRVEKQYVVQGETINYINESYDPDGDKIVEEKWTGQSPFFFQTGIHLVTLQVKDSRGLWSKPTTVKITVWRKVKTPAFFRQVGFAKIGEIIDLSGEEPLSFKPLTPIVKEWGPTLLLSDSPENITQDGILYADQVVGSARLYYYHKNVSQEKKRIYILAENKNDKPANIDIYRSGQAGPSTNELVLGKVGLSSYFSTPQERKITVKPGETVIVNTVGSKKSLAYGQIAHEIMDVVTDMPIRFTYLVIGEKEDVFFKYALDPIILPRDNHPRGTFINANRYLQVPITTNEKQRILLADNQIDKFAVGKDNLTGETAINQGNYGILYTVSTASDYKVGLVTEVRGGAFCGSVVSTDGKVYSIPNKGYIKAFTQGVLNGFFNPGQDYSQRMLFMIPVASSTPVDLLVAPLDDKK